MPNSAATARETAKHDIVNSAKAVKTIIRARISIELDKGAEMGRFNLGSTVIVLMGANTRWDAAITPEAKVRLGQALGHYD